MTEHAVAAAAAAALGHNIPAGVMAAAVPNAGPGGVSWADRLRNFQIDVPAASYDLTSSDGGGGGGGVGAGVEGGGGGGGAGEGAAQSAGEGADSLSWDGQGVEAATVIQHRRRFDIRCTAYEVRERCGGGVGGGARM